MQCSYKYYAMDGLNNITDTMRSKYPQRIIDKLLDRGSVNLFILEVKDKTSAEQIIDNSKLVWKN